MLKNIVLPLTSEELVKMIENNQSHIMFTSRGQLMEHLMRDDVMLQDYNNTLHKYPPIYADDESGMYHVCSATFPRTTII